MQLDYLYNILSNTELQNLTILLNSNQGNLTLFAPPNNVSSYNNTQLNNMLRYNTVNGSLASNTISEKKQFSQTLLNSPDLVQLPLGASQVIVINKTDNTIFLNTGIVGVKVNQSDIIFILPPEDFNSTMNNYGLNSSYNAFNTVNLISTIESIVGITILVANNEAFESDTDYINYNSSYQSSICSLHIIPELIYSTNFKTITKYNTLNEGKVEVTVSSTDGEIDIGGAKIIYPDILIKNGVIHVIDRIIKRNSSTTPTTTKSTSSASDLPSAAPANFSDSNSLDKKSKIGIGLGVGCFVIVAGAFLILLLKWYRAKHARNKKTGTREASTAETTDA
ncbi:5177_t:CDS:2 [Diversispora eburnea]|uniref:5177_t:CDS:1 n=1 Tax=Diversispora eburnea TaxID=1213867 RepID=A0A9N9BSM8_9GLOM|nr:5177_t:CDS:2 [Diversispora eburnea]